MNNQQLLILKQGRQVFYFKEVFINEYLFYFASYANGIKKQMFLTCYYALSHI